MSTTSQIIASSGLVLDVLGVAVLFFYGPPQPDFQEADVIVARLEGEGAEEARRLKKRFTFRSRIGLSLLIVGFLLQLAALWCQ